MTNELQPSVSLKNGQVYTTSLAIAEHFGKRHADVLRAIQNLDCSAEFNRRNFAFVEYVDSKGELRPCVEMTRDGFTFLAMGFTGKEAARWKEAYIRAFNMMERELLLWARPQPVPAPSVAGLAFEYVKRIERNLPNLGESALQQLYSDASEIDFGRRLVPLPVVSDDYYTATELATEFGVSRNKIGRVANSHGLKTAEFGEFRLSKAEHSDKQVEQFYYNERGRQALKLALSVGTRQA